MMNDCFSIIVMVFYIFFIFLNNFFILFDQQTNNKTDCLVLTNTFLQFLFTKCYRYIKSVRIRSSVFISPFLNCLELWMWVSSINWQDRKLKKIIKLYKWTTSTTSIDSCLKYRYWQKDENIDINAQKMYYDL